MTFPYQAICAFCDDHIRTVRLSNIHTGLEAYVEPHICKMKTKPIKNRFRLALRILIGQEPYITDNEDDPYAE